MKIFTIKTSTSSQTQKENETIHMSKEGICGTGILIVLSIIPLLLKKLKL